MYRVSKRVMSWLLTLAVIVSMIPSALAAETNTAERHKVATKLSTQAESYYTSENSIDNLYKLQGDSSGKSYEGTKSALYKELQNLMSSTMTNSVTYNGNNGLQKYWPDTDADSRGNKPVLFYSDVGGTFNREHVWPKSKGSFHETYAGSDLHHLRPANEQINSSRGNAIMGNVRDVYSSYNTSYVDNKPVLYRVGNTSGSDENARVEINDNIKGDVARIFLYVYVRWGEPNLFENVPSNQLPPPRGSDSGGNNGQRAIESLNTLLEWCQNDPVDEWEMRRNDLTQSIQGNRNVFIDYPELAWKLFNKPVPAGMQTPSGGKGGVEPPDPKYEVTVLAETSGTGTVTYDKGYITTTPAEGYYTAGATVEPSSAATVTQSGNSFVLSNVTASCTIRIRFAPKQSVQIAYALPEGVAVAAGGPTTGYLNETITLPQVTGTPADHSKSYTFMGWVESAVDLTKERSEFALLAPGSSYTLRSVNVTLYALYSYRVEDGSGAADTFELVTANKADWSGDYVITNPNGDTLLLPTREDIDSNTNAVSIATTGTVTKTDNTISGVTVDYVITAVPARDGEYTLQIKGKPNASYLSYPGGGNAIGTSADPSDPKAQWTLALSGGSAVITNVGNASFQLKWNNVWKGFRCYPSGQENVKLFAATGGAFSTFYLTLGEGTPPVPATISYAVPKGVSVVSGPTTGVVGQPITLPNVSGTPGDATKAYAFAGWVEEEVADTTARPAIYPAGAAYTVKTAATKLYALFTYTTTEPGGGTDAYTLVKDAGELSAGDQVVLVSKTEDKLVGRNSYYALGTKQNANNRATAKVTKTGETVELSADVAELTLEAGNKAGTFAFKAGGTSAGYLYAAGKLAGGSTVKGNWLRTEPNKSDNSSWKIDIAADGNASIVAQGENDANIMRYNPNLKLGSTTEVNGDSLFGCYGPASSVKGEATDLTLYKKTTGSGGPITVTHYLTLSGGEPPIDPPVDPKPGPLPDPIPANIGYSVPEGVTTDGPTTGEVGKAITLPNVSGSPEDTGKTYEFEGWVEGEVEETTNLAGLTILAPGASYTVTKQAVEFFALFSYKVIEDGGEAYTLVRDSGSLAVGDKVVITAKNFNKALGTTVTAYPQISAVDITKTGDTVAINENVAVLTLKAGLPDGFFAFETDGKYLAAIGSEKNTLDKEESITANSSWKITIAADAAATVVAENAEKTSNNLRFKTSADPQYIYFSCYASGQEDITLYKLGSAGSTTTTYYLTLTEGGNVQPPAPTKLPAPVPTRASGTEVVNGHTIQFATAEGSVVQYVTQEGATDWQPIPAAGYALTGEGGAVTELWVKAVKTGRPDSDVVKLTYTIKDTGIPAEKLPVPEPNLASGSTVESGTKITFKVSSGAKAMYKTNVAGSFVDVPDGGVAITGSGGDWVTIGVKAVKDGARDSDVVTLTYIIKKPDTPTPGGSGGAVSPAKPIVKAEDVKVNDGTAEIKLPSADARLDDAANKKAVSANATKPIAITGGGLSIIIPAGTLSAGADVNALLVDPKASGSVIKVIKPDGTTAILPISTVSGGKAAYVANIPGKYEVADNTKTFPDTGNHWALPAIGFVSARELFKGDSTGAFNPDQTMTRGMLAAILGRIDGGKSAVGAPFADVPSGSWYAKEIAWAAQNKLVEGDGKNFDPDADLTREQLCVILVRYLDYSGLILTETTSMGGFSDLSSVSPWAKDAVEQAVRTGLIDGKTGGLLDPQGKATRAEIATILQRFVEGVLK